MFVFDILIYLAFAMIMAYFAKGSVYLYADSKRWDKYLILYILFFSFIAAIRWNTGSDAISYARMFDAGQFPDDTGEFVWLFFVKLIHELGIHWTVAFGILAFVQIYFIVKPLKEYKFILIALPFVLFGGRYWDDLMGAVRQMVIGAMFVWASLYIYKRKLILYFLFVIGASTIHRSALILLPFYFMPTNYRIMDKRYLLIFILIACCLIGQTPAYQGAIGYIQLLTNFVGLDTYTGTVSTLLMQKESAEALAFGPMMLTYLLIPIFIVWYGPELEERYAKKIPYFNLWYNFAYFYSCGYFLVCNISHLFIRPMLYFILFQMILSSLLLYDFFYADKKIRKNPLIIILFCLVISLGTVWNIHKLAGKRFDSVTYKTFFFHTDDMARFGIK